MGGVASCYSKAEKTVNPRVLFLDDDPVRWAAFRKEVPHAVWVETASACVDMLMTRQWDFVFLDHDLGGKVHVDSAQQDTGMEVVRRMCAHVARFHHLSPGMSVIVHSYNHPASLQMLRHLHDAEFQAARVPFMTPVFSLMLDGLRR